MTRAPKRPMKQQFLYRNARAGEQLDLFFISAIASLLLTRLFLHLSGYPQIGGGGLHIAHMLWGGLFMLIGLTVQFAFLGQRARWLAAFFGGVGFGLFIDELGKFITSDNDYFYRPSIGIIYAVFVIIYLTFNFLQRTRKLTSREYQLNALLHLEEAIVHDMDRSEKRLARELLAQASQRSVVTKQIQILLDQVALVPENKPPIVRRLLARLDAWYTRIWLERGTHRFVRTFFIVESLAFVLLIMSSIYGDLDEVFDLFAGQEVSYGLWLLIGQLVSASAAAVFAISGALKLKNSRSAAFEDFRRATLINLFLTEFFIFSRIEFEALPGFVVNVVILLIVTYVLRQERRLQE